MIRFVWCIQFIICLYLRYCTMLCVIVPMKECRAFRRLIDFTPVLRDTHLTWFKYLVRIIDDCIHIHQNDKIDLIHCRLIFWLLLFFLCCLFSHPIRFCFHRIPLRFCFIAWLSFILYYSVDAVADYSLFVATLCVIGILSCFIFLFSICVLFNELVSRLVWFVTMRTKPATHSHKHNEVNRGKNKTKRCNQRSRNQRLNALKGKKTQNH